MSKNIKGKNIVVIKEDKDGKLYIQLDCEISQVYMSIINLVGVVEENTGIEYNQILEDLKENK